MSARPGVTIIVGGRFHAFDLAKGLHERGWLHRIITNYPRFKAESWGLPPEKIVALPAAFVVEQAARRLLGRRAVRLQLFVHTLFARGAARRLGEPALVHGWSSYSEPSIARAHAAGRPFVLERGSAHMTTQCELLQHEQRLLGITGAPTHPGIVEMELREYAAADRIATPSQFVLGTFRARGVPEAKLGYNRLGVDLGAFAADAGPDTGGARPFRIVYAGQLSFRKGIHYLCEAFRLAALPDAELVLVGAAQPETPALLGAPHPGIRTPGRVPQRELAAIYRTAEVFAIASIEEGMAMVQAQALACGLPLICTTNTGGEDLLALGGPPREAGGATAIREYPAGYVTPIRDPAALAECFRRLHADAALRAAKRAAALALREHRLDWGAYAERAIADYERLRR